MKISDNEMYIDRNQRKKLNKTLTTIIAKANNPNLKKDLELIKVLISNKIK